MTRLIRVWAARCVLAIAFVMMAAPAAARVRVAILEPAAIGIPLAQASAVTAALLEILAAETGRLGYDVISSSDIKAMLALEKQRDLLGCESDVSCLAEIGGALGTELMINGSIASMGGVYTLSLSLVDSRSVRVRSRFQGSAGSEAVLAETARRGVAILFEKQADALATGMMVVRTEPEGAAISLNGKPVGVSPLTLDQVPAGEHLVVAALGDARVQATVSILPEAIERVVLSLQGKQPPVRVKIVSSPPDARVFFDGQEVGLAPLLLPDVASGSHRVRVLLMNYRDYEETLEFSYDAYERAGKVPFKLDVTLKPRPVQLVITGLPDGAGVVLDDRPITKSGSVLPGRHKLTLAAAGHVSQELDVDFPVGRAQRLRVTLEPLPGFAEYLDRLASKRLQFIASGVVAALSLAVGVGAFVAADQAEASADAARASRWSHERDLASSYDELADTRRKISVGSLAVAVVSLAFSGYARLTYPDRPEVALEAIDASTLGKAGGFLVTGRTFF